VVGFDPTTRSPERAAVAHAVKGKLLGPAPGEGAYYLRVPDAGSESRLRAIADQVIRLPGVLQVGTKTCPRVIERSGTLSARERS
jgi:uncharacterized protein YbjT (DUF2867 family)